jgi:hypothetical protein
MGLFTPKITSSQLQHVQTTMKQLQESVYLLNNTTKPDVFFKRLNFSLDLLLDLQSYEKYKIFKGCAPTSDYNKIVRNMESTVNDFIDRAIETNRQKLATLKTDKAKRNNYEKFVIALIAAFDCANTFWTGNRGFPHYTGPLYTDKNYRRVQALFDGLDSVD